MRSVLHASATKENADETFLHRLDPWTNRPVCVFITNCLGKTFSILEPNQNVTVETHNTPSMNSSLCSSIKLCKWLEQSAIDVEWLPLSSGVGRLVL